VDGDGTAGKRKTWANMNSQKRAGSIVAGVIQLTLLVLALRDLRQRPSEQVRGPKAVWALVSFVNFVGPISYFVFGRRRADAAE
jgi:hypothetical protein